MSQKTDSNIHNLIRQKEGIIASLEKDLAELRRQLDALRAVSTLTAYERLLVTAQSVTEGQRAPDTNETPPASNEERSYSAVARTNKRGALAAAIISVLVQGEGQTIENVLEKVNVALPIPSSKEAVAKTLSRLAIEGKIQKIGYGSYALL